MTKEFKVGDKIILKDSHELEEHCSYAVDGLVGKITQVIDFGNGGPLYNVLFDDHNYDEWAVEDYEIAHIPT